MSKKYIVLLFTLLSITTNCFGQSGWVWSYPQPTGEDLYSIKFTDQNTGYFVGQNGTIFKTTEQGNTWILQSSLNKDSFRSIYFINNLTGFAVGGNLDTNACTVYKTTNSGLNWISSYLFSGFYLTSVVFINESIGFAAGGSGSSGIIIKTTNSGLNWTLIQNNSIGFINCLYFNDSMNGCACGENGIMKTINGGFNWSVTLNSGIYKSIFFANFNTGYSVGYFQSGPYGYSLIRKTTNGGSSWISQYGPSTELRSVFFLNQDTGFACGYGSVIIKTTNGGNNWLQVSLDTNTTGGFVSVYFPNSFSGYITGINGVILKTTNTGSNWFTISSRCAGTYINRIQFLNRYIGFAIGDYLILKTSNSGLSWETKYASYLPPLTDIYAVDTNIIYACGTTIEIKSTDGGNTWVNQNIIVPGSIRAISFLNSATGFCSGSDNQTFVSKTTNGGINWVTQTGLYSAWGSGNIFIVDSNITYINCGVQIEKTTNGGNNWFLVSSTGTQTHNIYFLDSNIGFVVGYHMSLYKTTDGGLSWYTKTSGGSSYYNAIHFLNSQIGYIVGDYGRIAKTTDQGESWQNLISPTDKMLYSFYATDTNTFFIGGGFNAIILKTLTGGNPIGIEHLSNLIPNEYSLHQNYPNPFNPQTKIKFDISKQSFAKLVIYDILGREVATLVNEELKPGTYAYEWDGSNYASGIYFYKLVVGDNTNNGGSFTETKKMVLMK